MCHSAVVPSDTAEKKHNMGAEVQSPPVHNSHKDWKIYFLDDFWCTHTLVHSSHFWTTRMKFDICCQRYIATCGKKIYRCTLALEYHSGIFLNL